MSSLWKTIVWVTAITCVAGANAKSDEPASGVGLVTRPPNIVILYADDLGFGDLGCYRQESKIPTPNLDRLASEGLRFTDAHSSSGICTPSRYALLTGRYHWRAFHGIVNAFGQSVLPAERLLLPEMLQARGYRTAAIGKWHLGWDWNAIKRPGAEPRGERGRGGWGPEAFDWSLPIPDGPLAHGFDSYFGDTVINFPPYGWIENDRLVTAPTLMMDAQSWKPIKEGQWECRPGPMVEGWDPYENLPTLAKRGVEFIESQATSDRPFFLYMAFPSPHAPIIPNDAFDGVSNAGPYGDFVNETDHCIGQILDALQTQGFADNTLVLFSADNGPEHYAYARAERYGHWSPQPLRGLKRDIYEGGHRVPFIVRWPGVIAPGRVSAALVSQIDVMATVANLLKFELPPDAAEDSHDLTPVLRGESEEGRRVLVHNTMKDQYAIRLDDWVLIDAPSGYVSRRDPAWEKTREYPVDDAGAVELYNLSQDLEQRFNLANEEPQRVELMKTLLQQIRKQTYSAPRLGYVPPPRMP